MCLRPMCLYLDTVPLMHALQLAPRPSIRPRATSRSLIQAIASCAACGLPLLVLMGCANSSRSALAVRKVLNTDGVVLHNRYEKLADSTNASNVLASLAAVAGAPGRIADLLSKLEAVAPPNIAPAFKTLAGSYREMGENEGKGSRRNYCRGVMV